MLLVITKQNIMKNTIIILGILVFCSYKATAQTVTDIDGNVYNTVIIDQQIWMKENLRVTHYNNGTPIPNITDNYQWGSLTSGARCYYNNDSSGNAIIYGALYNFYAVDDSNKLCPAGWHVASDHEWNVMEVFLDNTVDTTSQNWTGTDIGNKLRETGTTLWQYGNPGATNSSGFSARPGGGRNNYGEFFYLGYYGYWWTGTIDNFLKSWQRHLYCASPQIGRAGSYGGSPGESVRCIYDSLITQINYGNNTRRIEIYPIPAHDILFIDNSEGQEIIIQVYDAFGNCVLKKILTRGINNFDIRHLTIGVYIIRITGIKGASQQKLIIN
jgi:uncharacterized protein (TIGR02145 family)